MAKKRRQHSAQFKFEVVMTMLGGEQTVAELCRQYDITESLAYKWRDQFLEQAPDIFKDHVRYSRICKTSPSGYKTAQWKKIKDVVKRKPVKMASPVSPERNVRLRPCAAGRTGRYTNILPRQM